MEKEMKKLMHGHLTRKKKKKAAIWMIVVRLRIARALTADLGWVDLGRPGSKREWGETSRNVASRLW